MEPIEPAEQQYTIGRLCEVVTAYASTPQFDLRLAGYESVDAQFISQVLSYIQAVSKTPLRDAIGRIELAVHDAQAKFAIAPYKDHTGFHFKVSRIDITAELVEETTTKYMFGGGRFLFPNIGTLASIHMFDFTQVPGGDLGFLAHHFYPTKYGDLPVPPGDFNILSSLRSRLTPIKGAWLDPDTKLECIFEVFTPVGFAFRHVWRRMNMFEYKGITYTPFVQKPVSVDDVDKLGYLLG